MANLTNAEHTSEMSLTPRSSSENSAWLRHLLHPAGIETRKKALAWILVFASYLLTAQIGLFLYLNIGTFPAVIWAPVGIALSAVLIEGYWIGSAIAAGALINALLSGAPLFLVIGIVIASTIQPLAGGYFLRKLRFNPLLNSLRDVFLLIGVSVGATMISPLIIFGFTFVYNLIAAAAIPLPAWPQMWVGGCLSALILVPFLSRWIGYDLAYRTRSQQLELMFSVISVTILSYVIFATAVPAFLDTILLLLLLGAFFWIAFRVGPRAMSLALLMMTAISLAGAIYGIHPPSSAQQALSDRLLSTEVFDLILAFFFFILVSVEEQRKDAIKNLSLDAERLETALETIRAEDRAKNEFIATLAHELRNPLAPIMSGLELLRFGEKDPERIEILDSAQRQSFIMRRLLDELLDVARIARKTFVLKKEEVLLQKVLRESISAVRHFYKEREHTLVSSILEDEMWIDADPVRLAQIFTNILFNAGKYTEPGGSISLKLRKERDRAVIEITDTGIGISKEMLGRVFDPFVQDTRFDNVGTGLGIGLSIAKRLVELHGGAITALSEGHNRGSTFKIVLPVHEKRVPKSEPTAKQALQPASILIVDDNQDAAKSVAKLLRTKGHAVETVYTGKDALAAAVKKPRYVLLDIGLPDMQGYSVAKGIHKESPDTVVIALSGFGSRNDKNKAAEAGISVHLTKPASLRDIEAAMSHK